MKEEKFFTEELIKELIKLLLIIIIHIWISSTSPAKQNLHLIGLIKDNILIIITSLIYFFVLFLFNRIKRPIRISVSLKNFCDPSRHTALYRTGLNREDTKTVVVHIEIKETNSVWNSLALKMLKNKNIYVQIESLPKNQSLICQPLQITKDIKVLGDGFLININNLIYGNLENRIYLDMQYKFIVEENRDYPFDHNQDIPIKPCLLIDEKPLKLFDKLFCRFLCTKEDGIHIVEFTK